MAPRKGTSPFSPVRNPQLLDESTHWYVLSNRVCKERPSKYFAKSKFPSRFPQDIVKVKHSALRTQDGTLYDGKSSSDDEIIASSFGITAIFLRHLPDSPIFQEEAFNSLKGFLNRSSSRQHSRCSHGQDSCCTREKAIASRRLKMPSPTSKSLSSEHTDQDTGCFLLTPPSSNKKVSS